MPGGEMEDGEFRGRTVATLEAIEKSQVAMRDDFLRFQESDMASHVAMLDQLGKTTTAIEGVRVGLVAHIDDDNRRFGLVWRWLFVLGALGLTLTGAFQWLS